MLSIEKVTKKYEEMTALEQVSLVVQEGEFFSLLGPSGCGKSTLLRLIAGLDTVSEGEVKFNGESVTHLPPETRPFNTVFQNYALFPHLNVYENISFGLKLKKVPSDEMEARVRHSLEKVQLSGYEDRLIDTLSGGQKQRVALARALVNRPKILLLDEPLSALDLKLRKQMQTDLRSLQQQLHHTFIFVTHDQEEAMALSDRIAVMDHGKILQIGTPQEVYDHPTHRFVAEFVGHANFFSGTVKEVSPEQAKIEFGSGEIIHSKIRRFLPEVGQQVDLLVRPEKWKVFPLEEGAHSWFEGTIVQRTYRGAFEYFSVQQIQDKNRMIDFSLSSHASRWSIGDRVALTCVPEDVVILPHE
ncbi:MAG: spermidine/putrescine ABC transporter ATP-binding protein [Bdellovibrionaceae bacterium]|nr:spermidine/putrescine ABC transporter ATP-binding protein [Pseudobdellovibrionaceae bacterium]|tara:strand:+ start:4612 stop:5685 length:1074 start_codon:yes stop_codon:yes gene_type:complete